MAGEAGRPATRRDLILAIYDQEAMGEVTTRELALIQRALLTAFGEGGAMSPAEIAQVLLSEDLPVRFDSLLARGPDGTAGHPFDRYEELFAGRATPSSLREAKETILFLDRHWRQFQAMGDRTGTRYARQTAKRAASLPRRLPLGQEIPLRPFFTRRSHSGSRSGCRLRTSSSLGCLCGNRPLISRRASRQQADYRAPFAEPPDDGGDPPQTTCRQKSRHGPAENSMGVQSILAGLSWSGTATRLGAKAKDSPLQPPAKKLPDIRGSHRIRSIFQNFLARGQIFSWIPILNFARSSSGAGGKGAGEESANAPGNRLR